MKKLKEKMAAREGFTLVELIVVIAILGILAAVAVPTYTGYIKKAQQAADMQNLSSVATAVVGLAAGQGNDVNKIEVSSDGTITVTLSDIGATAPTSDEIAELTGTLDWSANFSGATLDYTASTIQWVLADSNGSGGASSSSAGD